MHPHKETKNNELNPKWINCATMHANPFVPQINTIKQTMSRGPKGSQKSNPIPKFINIRSQNFY